MTARADGHSHDLIGIVSRQLEHGIIISVSGEIDLATAPVVERELRRAGESHDLVAIDLRKTSFLDSTGLHAILAADHRLRESGGRLLIVRGPPQVSRLFELTGLSSHLDIVQNDSELARFAADGNTHTRPRERPEQPKQPIAQNF
jgi:anti-sigma B factor antagonist